MAEWTPPEELDEYRLVRLLGRGAMGEVYLAHDQLLDRPVAVKFVRAAEDPVARARALEEARAIARLQHPNVVAIYRIAEAARPPYLVSEYVRGTTLDELARPVPWKDMLALAIDLSRGLAAAHRSGVLHRDVKPANAILTDDGRGKLLDFGLARAIDAEPVFLPPRERAESAPVATDATMSSPASSGRDRSRGVPGARGSSPSDESDSFDRDAPEGSPLELGSPRPREAGTPLYMAPELWRGEPATRRSDLYALGVLLYELLAGTAPRRGMPIAELGDAVQRTDIPRLGLVAPDVDPALAAVVDRLVERDPGARFASADALLGVLEEIAEPRPLAVPDGNPYRGLAAFEAAHGSLFFGRRGEVRELVDRITADPITVVGGDSGTGKSSLCRAGVLPWLVDQGWSRVDVVPGRHPVQGLAAALAGYSGLEEAALAVLIRDTPDAVARSIRQNLRGKEHKLLLFVDQLEELLTQSDREEARVVATALAGLGVHTPSVRVLGTARSDFLSRLATLPGLGEELGRALYFLRPLTSERIREAIVRPAAVKGVTFESEALIDTLVEQTARSPGGLPLLQFTLAELWDARDADAKTIRSDSLAALGGVEGALTRHADRLLAGLDGDDRDAARRLLLRLVTADGTRARRAEAELLSDGAARASERRALEALVRGRIVVANDAQHGAYEIAHEALISGWSTLQDWRSRSAADHAVRVRLEHAAAIWDRTGRPRDLLWTRRQLVETRTFEGDTMAPLEAKFLGASRRSLARRQLTGAAIATVTIVAAVIVALTIRAQARREVEAVIAEHTGRAVTAFETARKTAEERDVLRTRAFSLFDAHKWSEGEEVWTQVETLAVREASEFRTASKSFETALSLDPARESTRRSLAELLFSRLLRAELDHDADLFDELAGRLAAYDDGRHQAQLTASAQVELVVEPPGTRVWIIEGPTREAVTTPSVTLRPGHVVFSFEAPGRAPVRLPVLLAHGESTKVALTLPRAEVVPAGMIYIPPGRFLFGSADSTDLRRGFLNSPPMHEMTTRPYLIARHEVTFGEWIAYLDTLPVDERRKRTPSSITTQNALELVELAPKKWQLVLAPTTQKNTAELGQPFRYEKRTKRTVQDWSKFPVTAISFDDARAYATWLDQTGKLPGARLCDEYEWERAARGADGRTFPSGATLVPDDANIDVTYGRDPLGFGPDEVGAHPKSRSPFGVDDLAGNAWEWTRSVAIPETPVYRGGGWYNAELSSRSVNREQGEPTQRNVLIGIRLCASAH